jgi:NTP pyrophosphatase (non-canonical NTP hydrolase)
MPVEITAGLRSAIAQGRCVLFLGAGVSTDSGAPSGEALAAELNERFLDGTYPTDNLTTVVALVDSEIGRATLNEYLHERFSGLHPSPALISLSRCRWRRIYTVNFDTLLEQAYENHFSAQQLYPIYTVSQRMTDPPDGIAPLYKLHGCITRTMHDDGRLTLTQEDFILNSTKRLLMLNQLLSDLAEWPLLYIGFAREDPDFIRLLTYIKQQMPNSLRRGVAVHRTVTDFDRTRWSESRVTLVQATVTEFIAALRCSSPRSTGLRPASYAGPTAATSEALTLDNWEDAFWALYGGYDLELPLFDMMLQMVNDSAHLAEETRKRRLVAAVPFVVRIFSWLCTTVTKVRVLPRFSDLSTGKRFSDLIWQRYPGTCFLCTYAPCRCDGVDELSDPARAEMEANAMPAIQLRASDPSGRPRTLNEWVSMFDTIYGSANSTRSVDDKILHLLEEIGEIEQELRKADRSMSGAIPAGQEENYAVNHWEAEIADVFSRLASVILHIQQELGGLSDSALQAERVGSQGLELGPESTQSFSRWVWLTFRNEAGQLSCHRCKKTECGCVPATRR